MRGRHLSDSLVLLGLLVCAQGSAAGDVTELPQVVVSATRSEQSAIPTAASITVITREQLEASGVRTVAEALRGQGGVQVSDLFGDGTRTNVGIRGFNETASSNTLVLVDGRELNNPDIAPPNLFSIPVEDVERIEIVQGSAGVLFGDQAVGGVINIITRTPQRFALGLEGGVGSYNHWLAQGSVGDRLSNGLNYRLSAKKEESDNYRENNDLDYENLSGRLGYEYATGSVFFELQHFHERLGAPGALFTDEVEEDRRQAFPTFIGDFVEPTTDVQRLGLRQSISGHWSFDAEATNRDNHTDFQLSSRFGKLPAGKQDREIQEFTPRFIGAYALGGGDMLLTLGYDWKRSDYRIQSSIGFQKNDQSIDAVYGQGVIPIAERWTLTLGARHADARNEIQDSFTFTEETPISDSVTVGDLGLAFRPDPAWRLFLRRAGNFRFPKVDELTDPVPGLVLQPQEGVSYELGAEWARGRHDAKLVLYRLDLDDEIATVPGVGLFGFPANTNIDATRRDGLILSGAWQVTERVRLAGSYSYVDARVSAGPFAGNRIPGVARNIGSVSAQYQPAPRWSLYAELQATGNRVLLGDFANAFQRLPGYGVVNLKADYHFKRWTFSARVNNLLNKLYSDVGTLGLDPDTFAAEPAFYPSPERNFFLSVRYDRL
jgi:iron complex outermembrane receptor protein